MCAGGERKIVLIRGSWKNLRERKIVGKRLLYVYEALVSNYHFGRFN